MITIVDDLIESCQYRGMSIGDPVGELSACCGVEAEPISQHDAAEQAAVFKALADPVRLRLLALIAAKTADGICVCDLVAGFDLSQPTISHHLKVLRQAGLVDSERRGTWVYYRVRPGVLAGARRTLDLFGLPDPGLPEPAVGGRRGSR